MNREHYLPNIIKKLVMSIRKTIEDNEFKVECEKKESGLIESEREKEKEKGGTRRGSRK